MSNTGCDDAFLVFEMPAKDLEATEDCRPRCKAQSTLSHFDLKLESVVGNVIAITVDDVRGSQLMCLSTYKGLPTWFIVSTFLYSSSTGLILAVAFQSFIPFFNMHLSLYAKGWPKCKRLASTPAY